MTRRQLFSIVLGTSLCLALAGAAVAQTTAPYKGEPKSPAAPVKPVPGLKLPPKTQIVPFHRLRLDKIEFSGQGKNWILPLGGSEYAPVARAGTYHVRVFVKNLGPADAPNAAKKCEIQVVGGKQVGTYGHSYDKTFTVNTPAIPANQSKFCDVTLDNLTDAGNYWVYPLLKD